MARRTKQEAAAWRETERARVEQNKVQRQIARLAREAAIKEERERKQLEREQEREEAIIERTDTIAAIVIRTITLPFEEKRLIRRARDIGVHIQDLPPILTGKISIAAKKDLEENGIRPTLEHFVPNAVAGRRILMYFKEHGYNGDRFDFEPKLVEMLDEYRQVHKVTKVENQRLRQHQLAHKFTTWEDTYQQAGIVLVDDC